MLTSVYLSKWNDNTSQWFCAWGDRGYQIWLWSEGFIKWFVFLLLILHRARQIGCHQSKNNPSLILLCFFLCFWVFWHGVLFLKFMYVYICVYICLFCVCVCMYACVPIAKSSCGIRRQLEGIGCLFPPSEFWASNSDISRHQTWQSKIFPTELAHQWPYSWCSLYPVICKVLRKLFISCNSHHHLCGALQFSVNICIFVPNLIS